MKQQVHTDILRIFNNLKDTVPLQYHEIQAMEFAIDCVETSFNKVEHYEELLADLHKRTPHANVRADIERVYPTLARS